MKKLVGALVVLAVAIAALFFLIGPGSGPETGPGDTGGVALGVDDGSDSGTDTGTAGDTTPEAPTGDAPALPSPDTPAAAGLDTLPWLESLDLGAGGGGGIAAQVVLAEGVPAMGALASVKWDGGSTQGFADGRGRLFVRGLKAGSYRVAVGFPGYTTIVREGVSVTDGKVQSLGVINLGGADGAGGPVAEYAVTVKSKDGGKPLAGARVIITTVRPYGLYLAMGTEGRPGELSVELPTGEDGRVVFRGVRPGTYDLLAIADGHALGAKPNIRIGRTTAGRHTFELPKGLAITGTVKHQDGSPATGAMVFGMNTSAGFKNYPMATVAEDGTFELGGLDRGNFMVMAFEDGQGIAQKGDVRPPAADIALVLNEAAVIRGRVIDKETKEPITNFTVRPYNGNQPMQYIYSMAYEQSDAEGAFSLTVEAGGPYTLEVRAEGYANLDVQGVAAVIGTPSEVTVEMDPIGIVTGVVRSAGDNAPLAGAEIFIRKGGFTPSAHKTLYAVSGPEGEFRITGLPIRPTNLVVTHPERSDGQITGVTPSGGEGTHVEVRLEAPGGVRAVVTDTTGQPAPGVDVNLRLQGDFFNMTTITSDAQGHALFSPLSAGNYQVFTGSGPNGQGGTFRQVTVSAGQIAEVEFGGVKPPGYTVTGTVTQDGAAVENASVQLFAQGGGEGNANSTARTAADGSFAIPDVPPGHYTLVVDRNSARASAEIEVLETGPPAPVALMLQGAGISGIVQDTAGKPVGGVWVTLEKVTTEGANNILQNYEGQDWAGDDGKFDITGLADGVYRLRAFHMMGSHAAGLIDRIEVSGGIGPDGVVVTLGAPRQITGRVTDVNGVPIEGANIRILDSKGRDFAMITFVNSGSDGAYNYGGLRADLYTVYAEAKGYAPGAVQVDLANTVAQTADFKLTPGATLKVVVQDAEGQPVANALIDLLDAGGQFVTKGVALSNVLDGQPSTNAQGVGYWRDLAPGAYKVRVRPVGKDPAEANAGAVAGSETTVAITLGG